MFQRILVPLDGSGLAESVLPYAEELAGRLGSDVNLLSVGELSDSERMLEFYLEDAAKTARRGAGKYPRGSSVNVSSTVLSGDPAEAIVDYADAQDTGLIIMATHGRSGIKRWALGSVADKVVRATTRPVILIRAREGRADIREKGILKSILVPLDGSGESEAVLPYVESLGSSLQAQITLLEVLPIGFPTTAPDGPSYISFSEEQIESSKTRAARYLDRLVSSLKTKGIQAKVLVRLGLAADEIMAVADEMQADLVAMSTHGRSGVGRWVFGSVADRVLHEGKSPIMLVRPATVQA